MQGGSVATEIVYANSALPRLKVTRRTWKSLVRRRIVTYNNRIKSLEK